MSLYPPSDDSFLLREIILSYIKNNANKKMKILDMGAGSGILAQTFHQAGCKNILAVDINPQAVKHLKEQKIKSIQSDLFSNLQKKKFDLIVCNPPYLPDDKREPPDSKMQTTAGKRGYELIITFLKQAQSHLTKKGKILLLFSSLSKPNIILKKAQELSYNYEIKGKKKLFFEELFVYELSKK